VIVHGIPFTLIDMKAHGPDQAVQASGETPPVFLAITILGPHSPSKSLILLSILSYFVYKSWC
jgi:hypothetical protein